MAFQGLTQAGSHTHHCPECHKSATANCTKNGHLKVCGTCNQAYSPKHNKDGCPYCKQKKEAEAARLKKEKKKDDDKKDKKGKNDNGEGSSKGGKGGKNDKKGKK